MKIRAMRGLLPRLLIVFIFALGLSGCLTAGEDVWYTPFDVEGNALQENEVMLVNARMYSPYTKCRNPRMSSCENQQREWLVVQMRFNDFNFAYRVGYAAPGGKRPAPDDEFNLELHYFYDRYPRILTIPGIDFSTARKVVSRAGREYWLTDWQWDAVLYQKIQLEKADYPVFMAANEIREHRSILTFIKKRAQTESRAFAWQAELVNVEVSNFLGHPKMYRERRLIGDKALAALQNPEQIYNETILAVDRAALDRKAKRKAAFNDNVAYQNFVKQEFDPLSLQAMVQAYKCPSFPGMPNIGHNPPHEFYELGDRAVRRAQCLDKVLNDYDGDKLIDHYINLQEREEALFAKTFGIDRYSIEEALAQINWAIDGIPAASRQAERLYAGGDQTARIWQKKRQQQQAESAMKRSLYQGLQNLNSQLAANNAQREYEFKKQLWRIQRSKSSNHSKKGSDYKDKLAKINSTGSAAATSAPAVYLMSEAVVSSCMAGQWSQQPNARCEVVENGRFVTLEQSCLEGGAKIEGYRTGGRPYSIWRFTGLTREEADKLVSAKAQSSQEFTAGSVALVKDIYFRNRTERLRIFWSQQAAEIAAGRYCNPGAKVDWLD